jgi:hypothetical protein
MSEGIHKYWNLRLEMAVVTLGFCQGQRKTAKTHIHLGLRRAISGMHKNLQDMRVGIRRVVTQERILIYVLITQKLKHEGLLSLYVC